MTVGIASLTGVGHIMVTPFHPDESIDLSGLRRTVDFVRESGACAIVVLGIMGEAHRLGDAERETVIATAAEQAGGRVPVIAGCTAESTFTTIERVIAAAALGAAAAMVAPPRAAQAPALQVEHYRRVGAAVPIPLVVQDEPVTTGVTMTAATIGEILRLPGAACVKVEQAPSPTKVSQILEANPDARCYGGLGGLYLVEELDRGAVGIMTGFAMPEVLVRICDLYAAGDREQAVAIFFQYLPLIRYEAQLGVGGVAIRKQLLVERGVIEHATVRGPVAAPDPRAIGELRALLAML
jgi:4-hydroxy-tetrahydrodipicolinate synthase